MCLSLEFEIINKKEKKKRKKEKAVPIYVGRGEVVTVVM